MTQVPYVLFRGDELKVSLPADVVIRWEVPEDGVYEIREAEPGVSGIYKSGSDRRYLKIDCRSILQYAKRTN